MRLTDRLLGRTPQVGSDGYDRQEVRAAEERWREHNRAVREAGCQCGKPATHVRRAPGVVGSVPVEIWSCEEHANVNGWIRVPGSERWQPVPGRTFDGWVGSAQREIT